MPKRRIKTHPIWLAASALLLAAIAVSVGAVFAYLLDKTNTVENTLVPARVSCEVQEVFDGNVKADVSVKNTGNVPAYIRAEYIVTWYSDSGEILATSPEEGVDHTVTMGGTDWVEGDDGYWYYTRPVGPEESTAVFIKELKPISDAPDGYSLSADIISSAIQAAPTDVVRDEWGVTVNGDGTILP